MNCFAGNGSCCTSYFSYFYTLPPGEFIPRFPLIPWENEKGDENKSRVSHKQSRVTQMGCGRYQSVNYIAISSDHCECAEEGKEGRRRKKMKLTPCALCRDYSFYCELN